MLLHGNYAFNAIKDQYILYFTHSSIVHLLNHQVLINHKPTGRFYLPVSNLNFS